MEFKKFSAGQTKFGTNNKPEVPQLSNVAFNDKKLDRVLGGAETAEKEALVDCLIMLAACHTIVFDKRKG